jgi:hypothetical protein
MVGVLDAGGSDDEIAILMRIDLRGFIILWLLLIFWLFVNLIIIITIFFLKKMGFFIGVVASV